MKAAWEAVKATADQYGVTYRTAANILALQRIAKAMELRGW
jgi:glutamate dehydrogenase/leucine dehydrogenase